MSTQNKKKFYAPSVMWNNVQSSIPPTNFAHTLNNEPCTHARIKLKQYKQEAHQKDVPALTASFCACTETWLFPAIFTASAMASRTMTPSPSPTTRLTLPYPAASCAHHMHLESVSSIAHDLPITPASRCEPPPPAIVPMFASGWPNCALGITKLGVY
jgi:hypothetical protein